VRDARRHRSLLIACFAIIYLIWGSSYLATSLGVRSLPPFLFGGIRFVIAGVALWIVARTLAARRAPSRPLVVDRVEWRHVAIVGFCTVLLSNGCNVWAMQWVQSNQSALLNVSSAFWIPIFGMLGPRGHAIDRRALIGLALGIAGTLLIVWPREGLQTANLFPQLVILVGCMGWAAGTIYLRNAKLKLDLLSFTALQMLVGGVMLTVLGLVAGEVGRWNWSPVGLAAMAYLTVFSSCVAYAAYAWLAQNTSPARVATYGYVNPAIATLLGWWVLGELLTGGELLGMAVILVGVVLVNWPDPEPAPEAPG